MEPRIQYVRTSDGASVAYWTLGEGPALVTAGLPGTHIGLEWQTPAWRTVYEQAAQLWRLVRFDHRGCGLSEREVDDFSLDALVRDLDAVIGRLGPEPVRLMALAMAGTVALAYAARHPERVSHLIVVNATDRGADLGNETLRALTEVASTDWEFAAQAITRVFVGWQTEEAAREAGANFARSIHPRQLIAMTTQAAASWDVSNELSRIAAKTLVLQNTRFPGFGVEVAGRLGAAIADCEVALLDGPPGPFLDPAAAQLVGMFLLDVPHGALPTPPPPAPRSKTAVILIADIADSTALTEQLGDVRVRDRARALDASLRSVIRRHAGEPIDGTLLGDGVIAVFGAARDAIAAGLECAAVGDAGALPLHVGVHAGDVIEEDRNVYGGTVNLTARISAAAPPGHVLVSEVVRSLARTSAGVEFSDAGEHVMKGIAEPHRLFRVTPLPAA